MKGFETDYRTMRIISGFILLFVTLFCTVACHEKGELPPPDDILYYGEHKVFNLAEELRELKKKNVVCAFRDREGNIFKRAANLPAIIDWGSYFKKEDRSKTSTYGSFNFTDIWAIDSGINGGYPYLRNNHD